MTASSPAHEARSSHVTSALSLAGGVAIAAVPPVTLSIASRTFSPDEQGLVSFVVTASTFVGQLVFAAVIESRLSTPGTDRRVTFPRWLGLLTLAAAVAVVAAPTHLVLICLSLPILVAGLEVGRGVSVAERLDRREVLSAVIVAAGAFVALAVAYLGGSWGFAPLALGIAVATLVRLRPVSHVASAPSRVVVGWVLADVGFTGALYPALNALILVTLGPSQAFVFASVSTVSGLLAIPLNFMRVRLLRSHSFPDIVLSAATAALGTVVILVGEWAGILAFVFGESWSASPTAIPLVVACLWRAASMATTLPFAALRRAGRARLLTVLRAACSLATFGAAALALPLQSTTALFAVLLAGELTQAVTYEVARRRSGIRLSGTT